MQRIIHGVGFLRSALGFGRVGPASRLEEVVQASVVVFGVAFALDLSRLLFWGAGGAYPASS